MTRERELVELVDPKGRPIGACTVGEAHREPGRLHRAFSVLLVDPRGWTLLQRRSAHKTRFPLRWANACCGHPRPDESVVTAAGRRLTEEIGLRPVPLSEVGVYAYRAVDAATGRVEHEYDHVLLGRVGPAPAFAPDPMEVAELRWTPPDDLRRAMATDPDSYAPWLAGVVEQMAGWSAAVD